MASINNIVFENADIVFRNFSGRAAQFNDEGNRNFCVLLDPEKAEAMKAEGWNVKQLRVKEEGDEPRFYVQVAVNFDGTRPPKIILITSRARTELDDQTVDILDYADLGNVDVILNPYAWEVRENKGIKAYLKSAYITLNEDPLELKYAAMEDAQDPMSGLSSTVSEDEKETVDA